MKKSLARAPLLVPLLFVAACNTASDGPGSLTSAALPPPAAASKVAAPARPAEASPRAAQHRSMTPRIQVASLGPVSIPASDDEGQRFQSGRASWYGPGFHGRRTASGETFNATEMTAAHRTLPFGTRVRVENARTGRSVVVRINDRGPFHGGRIIDLATGPARLLGLTSAGSAYVSLHRLD